jgi:hypothetical protein
VDALQPDAAGEAATDGGVDTGPEAGPTTTACPLDGGPAIGAATCHAAWGCIGCTGGVCSLNGPAGTPPSCVAAAEAGIVSACGGGACGSGCACQDAAVALCECGLTR